MMDPSSLEYIQETNLHKNWRVRKDDARIIGHQDGYGVFQWKDAFGRCVFYIVRDDDPLGYISCFTDLDSVTVVINSTYVSYDVRKHGLATMAYLIIIRHLRFITSDADRSAGGEALWQKLSRNPLLSVQKNTCNQYVARAL